MQQVASDNGMTPITGPSAPKTNDVGGLIAAVESKMAELMAWHTQQTRQLETDKTVLEAQVQQQRLALETKRGEIANDRKQLNAFREMLDGRSADLDKQKQQLADRVEQVDQQRIKLVELTSKLRAEEAALSREWAEVQRERESLQQQAAELSERRQRIDERAKTWLTTTAAELSRPLRLTDTAGKDIDRSAA